MLALIQRVTQAHVEVAGKPIARIAKGLLVLVCAEPEDTDALADKLVAKLIKLRIFSDANGKMNWSVADVNGGLLIVSQFTLAADLASGNRPSFTGAAGAQWGRRIYERVLLTARALHPQVECGEFGADMQVHLVNDGPVTMPITVRA